MGLESRHESYPPQTLRNLDCGHGLSRLYEGSHYSFRPFSISNSNARQYDATENQITKKDLATTIPLSTTTIQHPNRSTIPLSAPPFLNDKKPTLQDPPPIPLPPHTTQILPIQPSTPTATSLAQQPAQKTPTMPHATKYTLFDYKDSKRAQAQRRKHEQETKVAVLDQKAREQGQKTHASPEGIAEFNLFVEDWTSRSSGERTSSGVRHERDSEENGSTRQNSPPRPATLIIPTDTDAIGLSDAIPSTNTQGSKGGMISTQFAKLKGKMTSSDDGARPRGTEVIELQSPVELERLTEFSGERSQDGKGVERGGRKRGDKKAENVKVVTRKGEGVGGTVRG